MLINSVNFNVNDVKLYFISLTKWSYGLRVFKLKTIIIFGIYFQKFTNEDHLAVHMRKHEMSLALNIGSGLTPGSGRSPLSGLMPPGLFLGEYNALFFMMLY